IPPTSSSRSITVTGPMPRRRSSMPAARPEGPPPTITAPSTALAIAPSAEDLGDRISTTRREDCGELGRAEEPLAAAHQRARPAPQPVEVRGWDRALHGLVQLPAGDALAEADDVSELGIAGDQLRPFVRARLELADVGHPEVGLARFGRQPQAGLGQAVAHVLGDRHRGRDA